MSQEKTKGLTPSVSDDPESVSRILIRRVTKVRRRLHQRLVRLELGLGGPVRAIRGADGFCSEDAVADEFDEPWSKVKVGAIACSDGGRGRFRGGFRFVRVVGLLVHHDADGGDAVV